MLWEDEGRAVGREVADKDVVEVKSSCCGARGERGKERGS